MANLNALGLDEAEANALRANTMMMTPTPTLPVEKKVKLHTMKLKSAYQTPRQCILGDIVH